MSLYTRDHDAPRVVEAASRWATNVLVDDGSVFSDEPLATRAHFDALDRYFVQRPDEGSGSFYEKLEVQLSDAPPEARKLMAELLWMLLLFPSNVSEETKRSGVKKTWAFSGETLDPGHPLLADSVLGGVGSGGMGVNTNRWRELNYMVAIGQSMKALPIARRRHILSDYDAFLEWIDTLPRQGNRQFRHMLRYLLFPERVERMSSNNDRIRVLEAFGITSAASMSDRMLDEAMLALRREWEQKLGTPNIDFYIDPLRSKWKAENESDEPPASEDVAQEVVPVAPAPTQRRARNVIFYGPPGTGKTRHFQKLFKDYTDQAADVDRDEWLMQLVAPYGWRAVVAAALAGTGQGAKVDAIEAQELFVAKQRQRNVQHPRSIIWNALQAHTSQDCTYVNVADKRPPYLFEKDVQARWSLLPEWRDADADAAGLFSRWQAGQVDKGTQVRRYRVVTFHPSYAYEDFVVGLRPVASGEGENRTTAFRMVDGVFKSICAEARANPARRHALFIDEINRAQIAKVFGELMTLVEPDKRARYDADGNLLAGMEVLLPGTGGEEGGHERFGVPENLDLYGTMNTADRSIAQLDIALRRRFEFVEMAPDYEAIDRKVDDVHLASLLARVNDRIEFLHDRDHLIGHGYFTRVSTLEELRAVFREQVIPLLHEYFFDDPSRVALVLSRADGTSPFVAREVLRSGTLFAPAADVASEDRERHRVTPAETWTAAAFRSLYESQADDAA